MASSRKLIELKSQRSSGLMVHFPVIGSKTILYV
jgi:hypothetical protein